MAYLNDIFVSYRRSPTVGEWTRKYFVPLLKDRLNENSPAPIRVFHDDQIEEGSAWPSELKTQLKKSKILLTVWSSDYFHSRWCIAEWKSFLQREKLVATARLIYPVRYADGDYYPAEAKQTQCTRDFTRLNYVEDAFRRSEKWLAFDDLVQEVAADLTARLAAAPPYKDFPIVEPQPLESVKMRRPRI